MPKIDYGLDPDELDDEEREMLEEEIQERPKGKKKASLQKVQAKKKPKVRYSAFVYPERMGIADTETGEILAEGQYGVLQALANIVERLERIELKIGNLIED